MHKFTCLKLLLKLRDCREWIVAAFLTVFAPRKLAALRCDHLLASDVERRWGHSIKVWQLIYERDDWKRYRAAKKAKPDDADLVEPDEDDFLVFIDPGYAVDWVTVGNPDKTARALMARAEAIGTVDCGFLKAPKLLEFRSQIAQVIVCALHGEIEAGEKLLAEAQQYLAKRTVERSREWTLISLISIAVVVVVSISTWQGQQLGQWIENSFNSSLIGGFVGAFASIAVRTGKEKWDAAAGGWLHFLEVIMRLLIGVVFGSIATSISATSFGPKPMQELVETWNGCLVVAFTAGFFERSVPRIISKYGREKGVRED